MPVEERQTFEKNTADPSQNKTCRKKLLDLHRYEKALLGNPDQPFLDRVHTREELWQSF